MMRFFDGVSYFFAGFGLIAKPGLRRFVVIPLLINIFLFCILFTVMRHYIGELNVWVSGYLPAWLQWMSALIWVLFFVSFFLVFIYAFAALGTVVAAPFNGLLSEKVELYLTGKAIADTGMMDNVKDVPRVMRRQLTIIGYYVPRALLILLLMLVPVLHTLAIFLWFCFSAWYLTLQYLDFPTDNHQIPIDNVKKWMGEHRSITWGFAFSLIFVMSIPIVNFFAIPAAAAGATKFWLEEGGH